MEKKDLDEEPMEMVIEKMTDDPEAEVVEKHVGVILTDKMAEDLKPMDTDKENLAESKSPEEIIQEDSGSDIAPMQTDEQVKQVQETFPSFLLSVFETNIQAGPDKTFVVFFVFLNFIFRRSLCLGLMKSPSSSQSQSPLRT